MRERDYRWDANESSYLDGDLDRVINTALAMYATVEAREGLEQRILANLRDPEPRTPSKWWAWGLAAAALAMIILVVAWRFNGHTRPSIANHPASPQAPVENAAPKKTTDRIAKTTLPVRRPVVRAAPADPNPKLDQFPSPQPMSDQEKILAMYINQYPEHAALIAEARMEALRQDEAEKVHVISADDQGVGR